MLLTDRRFTPLTEERTAHLILRYIANAISPAEKQELMEGYVDLSPANRLAFERLTTPANLLNSLREYYAFMQEVDDIMEKEFGPDIPIIENSANTEDNKA